MFHFWQQQACNGAIVLTITDNFPSNRLHKDNRGFIISSHSPHLIPGLWGPYCSGFLGKAEEARMLKYKRI